jgi:hypothetical protein
MRGKPPDVEVVSAGASSVAANAENELSGRGSSGVDEECGVLRIDLSAIERAVAVYRHQDSARGIHNVEIRVKLRGVALGVAIHLEHESLIIVEGEEVKVVISSR